MGQRSFSDWWGEWKDYSITYMASESTNSYLSEEEKKDLLYLFEDLQQADSCSQRQDIIERNQTLTVFGKQYDFLRGYLFDILFNYDYEKALIQVKNRTDEEKVAFTIVNSWKVTASIDKINRVIDQISKCYPKEYVD